MKESIKERLAKIPKEQKAKVMWLARQKQRQKKQPNPKQN